MPPLAAGAALFLIAFPVILLMAIWTVITMGRILFPERALPFDAAARREAARRRGQSVPVRVQDILDDQRRRPPHPALPQRDPVADGVHPEETGDPLFDDLWLRRN